MELATSPRTTDDLLSSEKAGPVSSPRGLPIPELPGFEAPDVVAVLLHLAVGALLRPTQVSNGDLRRGLVHLQTYLGPHTDHRPTQQYVAEPLGHLATERVEDLRTDDAGLCRGRRGERHPQRRVVPSHPK